MAAAKVVELSVSVAAQPGTVYRFFTDPLRFARWWAVPGGGKAEIESKVGGAVAIHFQHSAVMRGKVVKLARNKQFVFTWGMEGDGPVKVGSTRVEITLKKSGDGTLLRFKHKGLKSQRDEHESGWRYYLSVLAAEAAKDQFAGAMQKNIDAYFQAWNTADEKARKALLKTCWAADGKYRDAYGCTDGLDSLNKHISNTLRHMPGISLVAAAPAEGAHGYVRVPWRAVGANGAAMFTGDDFAILGADGKIRVMVGFWDAASAPS